MASHRDEIARMFQLYWLDLLAALSPFAGLAALGLRGEPDVEETPGHGKKHLAVACNGQARRLPALEQPLLLVCLQIDLMHVAHSLIALCSHPFSSVA